MTSMAKKGRAPSKGGVKGGSGAQKRAPRPSQKAEPHVVGSQAEVAQFFGVVRGTVTEWLSAGAPGEPGKYDLGAIAAWRHGRSKEEKADTDKEFKRHRADLALLRLQRERGELIELSIHESSILRMCSVFRNGLLGSIPTLAAQLEGLDERLRRDVITQRFDEILESVVSNSRSAVSPRQKKRRGSKGD